jgi:phosphate starvation-inducible membrane PsiE
VTEKKGDGKMSASKSVLVFFIFITGIYLLGRIGANFADDLGQPLGFFISIAFLSLLFLLIRKIIKSDKIP